MKRISDLFLIGVRVFALPAMSVLPQHLSAQGLPVKTASPMPLWTWVIGVVILGALLFYGIMRNRTRTAADKATTEQGTKDLYKREERDRLRSGAD